MRRKRVLGRWVGRTKIDTVVCVCGSKGAGRLNVSVCEWERGIKNVPLPPKFTSLFFLRIRASAGSVLFLPLTRQIGERNRSLGTLASGQVTG